MNNPAVLFYTSDFMTGTLFMSNEEVGAYIRLLCMQHQKGHLSKEDMLKICKKEEVFNQVILNFKTDKKGMFYNKRMDLEKEKRQKYSESRANNRKKKTSSCEEDMKNISKSYEKHMENENIYIINNKNNNILNNLNNNINIYDYFNNNIHLITNIELERLNEWLKTFKEDVIKHAIDICCLNNVRTFTYLEGILKNWKGKNLITLEEIKQEANKRREEKEMPSIPEDVIDYDWLNSEDEK